MTAYLNVPTQTLRVAFDLLMRHVEEVNGSSVLIDKDYYWAIPVNSLYDVYNEPDAFTIGQLTECLAHLEKLRKSSGSQQLRFGLAC